MNTNRRKTGEGKMQKQVLCSWFRKLFSCPCPSKHHHHADLTPTSTSSTASATSEQPRQRRNKRRLSRNKRSFLLSKSKSVDQGCERRDGCFSHLSSHASLSMPNVSSSSSSVASRWDHSHHQHSTTEQSLFYSYSLFVSPSCTHQ